MKSRLDADVARQLTEGSPREPEYEGWVTRRDPVPRKLGLSMAGHCRMELWLIDKGYPPEGVTPSTERVFEYGDMIEALVFDDVTIHGADGDRAIGSWISRVKQLVDPETGAIVRFGALSCPQEEVDVHGFKGHIDRIGEVEIELQGTIWKGLVVLDSKSANGRTFKGAEKGNLLDNVFSREAVIQQVMYVGAKQLEFAVLIYSDKEKGGLMCRVIPFNGYLFGEGTERLLTATLAAEPTPDFQWFKGSPLPLRCSYCQHKFNCARVRGQAISEPVYERGRPVWYALS